MALQTADGAPKVASGPSELLGSAAGGGLGPSGCEAVCDPHGAGHAPEVLQYLEDEVEEAWCPSLRDSRAAWGPGRIHGGLEPVDARKNCNRGSRWLGAREASALRAVWDPAKGQAVVAWQRYLFECKSSTPVKL